MIKCQNCGQINAPESNFCRSCGTRFALPQAPNGGGGGRGGYEYSPPSPYSWKTDEYQTQNEARKTQTPERPVFAPPAAAPPPYGPPGSAPLAYRQGQYGVGPNYRCPNCGSGLPPVTERRVSTAGWIVFAVLLVMTGIFFWIGLLIREDVSVCPTCRRKVY